MKASGIRVCHAAMTLFGALLLRTGPALAYDQYSTNGLDNCAACHGDFRSDPYTERAPGGATWAGDLMTVHANMVNNDCNVCHSAGGRFPTFTNSSRGGTGLSAISCAGCHGRAEDGTGVGTEGYGAGLRQRHWNLAPSHPAANLRVCADCHIDANPANKVVVGENIQPPYYAQENANNHVNHPNLPADACNLTAPFEDVDGTPDGLDNEGDTVYDSLDSDCSPATPGPGETSGSLLSPLLVSSYDRVTGDLTLSYQGGCLATNNSIVYGPLNQVSTYAYSGQVCGIGNTGAFTWTSPSDSLFFLVVGNDGAREGSYGTRTGGIERPPYASATTCPLPQDLPNRCD